MKNLIKQLFVEFALAFYLLIPQYLVASEKDKENKIVPASICELKTFIQFSNLHTQNLFNNEKIVNENYKSPWLAFSLALMFPGMGQIYNGEYGKLGIMYGVAGIGAGMAIAAMVNSNYGTSNPEPSYVAPLGIAGVSIISLAWIYSIIDAPISANSINENNNAISHKNLSVINIKNCGIDFSVDMRKCKYTFGLSMNFGL
ncbi:MAG: hypothetical protein IPM32_05680 [Ignavibacteriae bacterium]|nr:hypothetical protein [Ignavibacteriota bacterium]